MRPLLAAWTLAWLALPGCDDDPADADADADVDVDADADSDADADADEDVDAPPAPVVETTAGPVRGARGDGYLEFLGIPYAAPPVGELRFRPPEPPAAWSEPLDATHRRACPQQVLGLSMGQEDCLVANVHTPDPMPEGAPVMVWIHGGGFTMGQGTQTDGGTRGDRLAAGQGVVVVSFNYRLGALGFLAHPALVAEGEGAGNWGFLDQVALLQWVQENAAAFGGDPGNVTIFGESAGGASVCLHMIAPRSAGLFRRGISQSGLCDVEPPPIDEAEAAGEALGERLGCEPGPGAAACLRAASAADLVAAGLAGDATGLGLSDNPALSPHPYADVFPGDFRDRVEAGEVNGEEVVVGWNADEGTLFVMMAETEGMVYDEATAHEAFVALSVETGVPVADIEAQYGLDAYPDWGAAYAAAVGDSAIACPSRRAALLLAPLLETRVYHFEYPDAAFLLPGDRELGAFHSAEVQYVFGHPARLGADAFVEADDVALHEAVSGAWARFAATGDPRGAVAWPVFDAATDQHLVFDRELRVASGADRDVCALWGSP